MKLTKRTPIEAVVALVRQAVEAQDDPCDLLYGARVARVDRVKPTAVSVRLSTGEVFDVEVRARKAKP